MQTPSPADETRLAALLERQRRESLHPDEQRELLALLGQHPDARSITDEFDREDQLMYQTIETAVSHFDFSKARRAIGEHRKVDRRAAWRVALMIGGIFFMIFLLGTPALTPDLWIIALVLAAPLLLWWLITLPRRRAQEDAGLHLDEALPEAYERFHRSARREFRITQGLLSLVCLFSLGLLIESLLSRAYDRTVMAVIFLLSIALPLWRHLFHRRTRARHERLLSGELDATAWESGKDRDR